MKTVTVNTAALEGAELDWAVVVSIIDESARDDRNFINGWLSRGSPSTEWHIGGPLIEKYKLTLYQANGPAAIYNDDTNEVDYDGRKMICADGDNILQAAMRAIVASELGDTVEIPEELL